MDGRWRGSTDRDSRKRNGPEDSSPECVRMTIQSWEQRSERRSCLSSTPTFDAPTIPVGLRLPLTAAPLLIPGAERVLGPILAHANANPEDRSRYTGGYRKVAFRLICSYQE
jgi:hypothetical protein